MAQGARAALITLGGDGALYCDAGGTLRCPAVAVQAVDTTAAGDAYIGALAAALAEDRSVADSLGFAAVAAGLAVTRLGAQPSLGIARRGRGGSSRKIACRSPGDLLPRCYRLLRL